MYIILIIYILKDGRKYCFGVNTKKRDFSLSPLYIWRHFLQQRHRGQTEQWSAAPSWRCDTFLFSIMAVPQEAKPSSAWRFSLFITSSYQKPCGFFITRLSTYEIDGACRKLKNVNTRSNQFKKLYWNFLRFYPEDARGNLGWVIFSSCLTPCHGLKKHEIIH